MRGALLEKCVHEVCVMNRKLIPPEVFMHEVGSTDGSFLLIVELLCLHLFWGEEMRLLPRLLNDDCVVGSRPFFSV